MQCNFARAAGNRRAFVSIPRNVLQQHSRLQRHYTSKTRRRGATPEATNFFCTERFPIASSIRERTARGSTGWTLSPIGFNADQTSTYNRVHQHALQYALQGGCNVLETFINACDGESELMIGNVINGLEKEGILRREELIITAKIGYLQGSQLVQETKDTYSDVVEIDPRNWHCMTPEFIETQLTESLERLSMPVIDVLLLHNPEYCYPKNITDKAEAEAIFYERIRRAITQLEREVERGRIQKYGISSNTMCPQLPNFHAYEFPVSLERCLQIASEVAGNSDGKSNFEFVQFPFNIHEREAYTEKVYNNNSQTLMQFAASRGLTMMTSRPLTSIIPNHVNQPMTHRYSDVFLKDAATSINPHVVTMEDYLKVVREALDSTIVLERSVPWSESSGRPQDDPALPHRFTHSWGHILAANMDRLGNYWFWQLMLKERIMPDIALAFDKLRMHPNSIQYQDWIISYRFATSRLFHAFSQLLQHIHKMECQETVMKLDSAAPSLIKTPSLSQKAVRVLCSTPETPQSQTPLVDCVVVGMREQKYVENILFELGDMLPPAEAHNVLTTPSTKWKPIEFEFKLKEEN